MLPERRSLFPLSQAAIATVLSIAVTVCSACQPLMPVVSPTAEPSATLAPTPRPTATPTPLPTLTATPSPSPTATLLPPVQVGPDSYPENTNPLTGLPADDSTALDRRPLLIKISNSPPIVRPQSGISFADLIFEYYVEGGWTRFAALFYSQGADHIGSVRSARLIDLQLAPAYDALLVFSGGSRGVIDTIRESDLYPWNVISPQFGYGEPYFVRFYRDDLPLEHTLFTDTAQLWQWAADRNVRHPPTFGTPGMAFRVGPPDGGIPARTVRIDYARTTAEWRFDPVSGAYLRWTDGIPHTDALTGQQLAFDNVVVISAYHDEVDLFPEKYHGAEKSIAIEVTGEGPAMLLRDGQAFDGRWVRVGEKDMFSFVGPDGEPLLFRPGQTFFQVIRGGFEQVTIEP